MSSHPDIDGLNLLLELSVLKKIIYIKSNTLIDSM